MKNDSGTALSEKTITPRGHHQSLKKLVMAINSENSDAAESLNKSIVDPIVKNEECRRK